MKRYALIICALLFAPVLRSQHLTGMAEFSTSVHSGAHTPLWQSSLQHGLSSLSNNGYLRGAAFYADTVGRVGLEAGLDIALAAGQSSTFIPQQYYIRSVYKWLALWAGAREMDSPLLNQNLTSGGLTWSGNARPIPQVLIGTDDYVYIARRAAIKAEVAYGWFTDGDYQKEHVASNRKYTRKIKYHHKSLFFKVGIPEGRWQFDVGLDMDDQFGGYRTLNGETLDLRNSIGEYVDALLMHNGGDGIYYSGNYLGTEYLKLTYRTGSYSVAAYLQNFYDDMSGMGKLNGMDGLWGLEYKSKGKSPLNGVVVEYYQTTNQSGPLHGLDFSEVNKTGGADDYYNHDLYPGWSHWGFAMANPLIASPVYNEDGSLDFLYNRVRAFHLGVSGDITSEWEYRVKLSHNRSWGTPFKPSLRIMRDFSTFAEASYSPSKLSGWNFVFSLASDSGSLYGDNFGAQLKVSKRW